MNKSQIQSSSLLQDDRSPQQISSQSAVKMMNFFQQLRDDCHDFILQNKKEKLIPHTVKQVQKSQEDKLNKIKRPISAFHIFYSENYHRVAKKHPGNPFLEMMRHMSQEWKELSQLEQEPYVKKHEQSKLVYQMKKIEQRQNLEQFSVKKEEVHIQDMKSINSMLSESSIQINDAKVQLM